MFTTIALRSRIRRTHGIGEICFSEMVKLKEIRETTEVFVNYFYVNKTE